MVVRGRTISGPAEALQLLKTEMAGRTDLHYKLACRILSEAMDGRLSSAEAREYFEAVMDEAEGPDNG